MPDEFDIWFIETHGTSYNIEYDLDVDECVEDLDFDDPYED